MRTDMITHKTILNKTQIDKIPETLKELDKWVVWRAESRKGKSKPTKVPYNARTGHKIDITKKENWSSFLQAVQAGTILGRIYDGVGFVLSETDNITIVDLDVAEGKELSTEQRHIVKTLASYTEYSPSGRGLHIVVFSQVNIGFNNQKSGIEVYSRGRYMTFTGKWLGKDKMEIRDCTSELRELFPDRVKNANEKIERPATTRDTTHDTTHDTTPKNTASAASIVERICRSPEINKYYYWTDNSRNWSEAYFCVLLAVAELTNSSKLGYEIMLNSPMAKRASSNGSESRQERIKRLWAREWKNARKRAVRKNFSQKKNEGNQENCPFDDVVLVDACEQLGLISTRKLISLTWFNQLFCSKIPPGHKGSASRFLARHKKPQRVVDVIYYPGSSEPIVTLNGRLFFNLFDPSTLPQPTDMCSGSDLEYIELIKKHFRFIFGGEGKDHSDLALQWFAHNVQNIGVKLPFALLVTSGQGAGKTFLMELMQRLIGRQNVGIISSGYLQSGNTGWGEGVALNFLEEVSIKGSSKEEIYNNIKPFITDSHISIVDKYIKNRGDVLNVTNYCAFSNNPTPLGIPEDDRRWMVFRPVSMIRGEIANKVGFSGTTEQYFAALYEGLDVHSQAVLKYFLEYQITDKFKAATMPPMTMAKNSMIGMECLETEGLSEAEDILRESVSPFFNNSVVCFGDFWNHFEKATGILIKSNTGKSKILEKLGFVKKREQIKICGTKKTVWVRDLSLNNDAIRTMLSANKQT